MWCRQLLASNAVPTLTPHSSNLKQAELVAHQGENDYFPLGTTPRYQANVAHLRQLGPWFSGKSPWNLSISSVFVRQRLAQSSSLRRPLPLVRGTPMFGDVSALEGLHVTGKYRDNSMALTCSRHAAWYPHILAKRGSAFLSPRRSPRSGQRPFLV
jgi:hypothetical protein